MGIINSIGKVFNSVASSPFGNALLTSASRRLSAAGLPFGGLFGSQDQNFAINSLAIEKNQKKPLKIVLFSQVFLSINA